MTLLERRGAFHAMVMADGPDNGQRLADIAARAVEVRRANVALAPPLGVVATEGDAAAAAGAGAASEGEETAVR
jgi:hypothetical protein